MPGGVGTWRALRWAGTYFGVGVVMSCLVAWGLVLVVEPRVGWQRETTVKDSVGYIYVGHRTVRVGAELAAGPEDGRRAA